MLRLNELPIVAIICVLTLDLILRYHCKAHVNIRKIPIISPGLIFAQKTFFLGLFSGELIFGGAFYWTKFCVSKWFWLVNKNS